LDQRFNSGKNLTSISNLNTKKRIIKFLIGAMSTRFCSNSSLWKAARSSIIWKKVL